MVDCVLHDVKLVVDNMEQRTEALWTCAHPFWAFLKTQIWHKEKQQKKDHTETVAPNQTQQEDVYHSLGFFLLFAHFFAMEYCEVFDDLYFNKSKNPFTKQTILLAWKKANFTIFFH